MFAGQLDTHVQLLLYEKSLGHTVKHSVPFKYGADDGQVDTHVLLTNEYGAIDGQVDIHILLYMNLTCGGQTPVHVLFASIRGILDGHVCTQIDPLINGAEIGHDDVQTFDREYGYCDGHCDTHVVPFSNSPYVVKHDGVHV